MQKILRAMPESKRERPSSNKEVTCLVLFGQEEELVGALAFVVDVLSVPTGCSTGGTPFSTGWGDELTWVTWATLLGTEVARQPG